jgi:hypothetical protein
MTNVADGENNTDDADDHREEDQGNHDDYKDDDNEDDEHEAENVTAISARVSGGGSGSSDAAEQEVVDTAEWEAVDTSEWGLPGKQDGWRMKHDHPDSETRKNEKKMLINHALQGGGLRGVWARTNMHYVHMLIDFFLRHPEKWMANERYNTAALRADLKKTTTLYDDQPAGNQPTRRRRAGARPPGMSFGEFTQPSPENEERLEMTSQREQLVSPPLGMYTSARKMPAMLHTTQMRSSRLTQEQKNLYKLEEDKRSCVFDLANIVLGYRHFTRDGGNGVDEDPSVGGCVTELVMPLDLVWRQCNQNSGWRPDLYANLEQVMRLSSGVYACEIKWDDKAEKDFHLVLLDCNMRYAADNCYGWLPFNMSNEASDLETRNTRRDLQARYDFTNLARMWRLEQKTTKEAGMSKNAKRNQKRKLAAAKSAAEGSGATPR